MCLWTHRKCVVGKGLNQNTYTWINHVIDNLIIRFGD